MKRHPIIVMDETQRGTRGVRFDLSSVVPFLGLLYPSRITYSHMDDPVFHTISISETVVDGLYLGKSRRIIPQKYEKALLTAGATKFQICLVSLLGRSEFDSQVAD